MTAVIPTTSVEVPDLGTVDEERLQGMKADELRSTLKVLGIHPPSSARKPMLLEWAINGLRLQALAAANAPVAAITPAPLPQDLIAPQRDDGVIPSGTKWAQIIAIAEYLARSNLTPEALRGKPNDIGSVLLRANDLGIPMTAALEQLYVIRGKVGMESKLMRALARRDGHHITDDPESNRFSAAVHGERADNGDKATGYFTLKDAVDQQLIRDYTIDYDDDGIMVVTVQGYNEKPQWTRDTANMLKQRATARLCRDLFSDCLAGVSYTPDELGYIDVEEAGPRGLAGEPEPTMTLNQQRSEIAGRIEDLPEDLKAELREAWKARRLHPPPSLTPAGIRTAQQLLEPVEAKAQERQAAVDATIEDAEVVEGGVVVPNDDSMPAQDVGSDAGEHGDAVDDGTTTVAASPAPPDLFCAGCGERISGAADITFGAPDEPWHAECYDERPMT